MDPKETPIEYTGTLEKWRGRFLPHWHMDDGVFFVTYGLRDAVESHQLAQLAEEREFEMQRLKRAGKLNSESLSRLDRALFEKLDELLDSHQGSQLLREEAAARIVANSFEFFDGERYELIGWVIMPTHVHVAFRAVAPWRIDKIIGTWKSYTAKEIKKALTLSQDHIWQSDYHDRLVRTVEELDRRRAYIWGNPEAAGLKDWGWRREYELALN